MSDSTIVIQNAKSFMTSSYLKRWVLKDKFVEGEPQFILKDDIPNKIYIKFKSAGVADEFISTYNGKSFEPSANYTLEISKETTTFEQEQQKINEEAANLPKKKQQKFALNYEENWKKDYALNPNKKGLLYIREEEKKIMYDGVKYLLKQIGTNLFQGKSILNTSLPVFIFDKRTLHQVFAYEHRLAPYYLKHAALLNDKMERLKWLTVNMVSILHMTVIQLKPFNPIIGETYQTKIGDFNLYLEHTVNHPITANFYGFDDEKTYKVYGYQITDASIGATTVSGIRLGRYIVEFKDGTKYLLKFPTVMVHGITMGDRLFNYDGKFIIKDLNNNLTSFVEINPESKGFFGLFKKTNNLPDVLVGGIYESSSVVVDEKANKHELKKGAKQLCKIDGAWTSSLTFDDVEYWNMEDEKLLNMYEQNYMLKSDGSKRIDLVALYTGQQEVSQQCKESLEIGQRADRKLRADWAEKMKKKK